MTAGVTHERWVSYNPNDVPGTATVNMVDSEGGLHEWKATRVEEYELMWMIWYEMPEHFLAPGEGEQFILLEKTEFYTKIKPISFEVANRIDVQPEETNEDSGVFTMTFEGRPRLQTRTPMLYTDMQGNPITESEFDRMIMDDLGKNAAQN